ncbi:MAG: ABC transporter ATP-binding protein [Ruminococcaceae bacterium]|nr:ABC transporter ATP-binding protein [Oscillospiraceae bacterium]
MLQTESVIKTYRQYDSVITAVNRVSIKVEKGEFIAIIGTSGSGKSTFLHICAGLDKANAGHVIIDGTDITKLTPDQLGKFRGEKMGFIYQRHNLIPQFTALENILLPTVMCNKPDMSYQESLRKLVESLNLTERLHHLPSELSGGQAQRVAIARALINNPQILFADEPTGNLDRANADEVLELLFKIRQDLGQTLVMVTHDLAIADQADRIFRMENGHLTLERDYIKGNKKTIDTY